MHIKKYFEYRAELKDVFAKRTFGNSSNSEEMERLITLLHLMEMLSDSLKIKISISDNSEYLDLCGFIPTLIKSRSILPINNSENMSFSLLINNRTVFHEYREGVSKMTHTESQKGRKLIKDAVNLISNKEIRELLSKRINDVIDYEPTIGVMGKTGAGKSSLCNSIFKGEVCPVSDVEACTRDVQELEVRFGDRSLKLLDLPGVGENSERDKEYEELYRDQLSRLDLILWVIKGDDRAFSADEHFYEKVLKPLGGKGKVLFVLNQIDKIEPFREWDVTRHCPSIEQSINIKKKEQYLIERFGFTEHPIISVSADENYNITSLVEAMIRALPKHAKSAVTAQLKEELKTNTVTDDAKDSFAQTVDDVFDEVIDVLPVPQLVKTVAKASKNIIVKVAKSVWGYLFS